MPLPKPSKQTLLKEIRVAKKSDSLENAAITLNIPAGTLKHHLKMAEVQGLVKRDDIRKIHKKIQLEKRDGQVEETYNALLQRRKNHRKEAGLIKQLEETKKKLEKELKVHQYIDSSTVKVPDWMLRQTKGHGLTGTPTLFLSDLHWSEVVDPDQIGGVNTYNMAIAKNRLRETVETTVRLMKTYINKPNYPGIVVALGGDLFSGDIHEELSETNEVTTMEAFLDLQANLTWALKVLADEFGQVFVPSVVGNHGRTSRKPRAKLSVKTNFDWLLGKQLELGLKHDKRITFRVSESLDTQYRVYGTRYNLTHGDQFSGGSGIAGILSPLMLGDHRKRKRQMAIGQPYDYMLCGHWHSLFNGRGLIINGSLKGYDEYAYRMNFQFEHPGQALWITHPDHDITYWCPVVLRDEKKNKEQQWVSLPS